MSLENYFSTMATLRKRYIEEDLGYSEGDVLVVVGLHEPDDEIIVRDIANLICFSREAIQSHLRKLRKKGLVDYRKGGWQGRHYGLTSQGTEKYQRIIEGI